MPHRIDHNTPFADGNAGKDSAVMTQSATVSSTTVGSLAAWLVALFCVSPVFAQLDQGIAPKTDKGKIPRPNGPGSVLLGNPADPVKTADNSSKAANTGVNGPTSDQLKKAIPPGYKVSPELENLLNAWEKKSQGVQRLNGNFRLYTYDEVFQSETRAVGKFWYQSPDKGRMDFEPADLVRVAKDKAGKPINPGKVGPNGQPYEVKKRDHEIWNCNGNEILQIFLEKKEYNRIAIPQQYQGESIKESPLPFLFGLKKDEAKERYLMQLGPLNGRVPNGYKVPCIHVIAYPLREQDSREWSKAEVLLDSQTFLPQSIQTIDPAGTSQSVYAFSEVEVNAGWLFKDPFSVPVKGYTLLREMSAQPKQQSSVPVAPAAPKGGLLK
jgi:TIGR03009 family protein